MFFEIRSLSLILFLHQFTSSSAYREKRSPAFIRGSTIGYLVAVAVPLDLGPKNVFLAFNFEANYALPFNQTHRDLIDKWNLDGHRESISNNITSINLRSARSIYNRKYFYKSFTKLLKNFGFNGKSCLLRTICELSESSLSDHNGLFGTLAQIILLPKTSKEENISVAYYEAEESGKAGNCAKYEPSCPHNILDMISAFDGE